MDEHAPSWMVGRERELATAETFLDRARHGAHVLRLHGDPGIGKSTVWRAVLERARERGFRVLSCRPAATETVLTLSSVADVLEQVGDDVMDQLPAAQHRILDIARARVEPTAGPPGPHAVGAAVRAVLGILEEGGPVLVGIDDAQWLDVPSATVLGFALRRLDDVRVSWLTADRSGEASRLDVPQLVPHDRLEQLRVGALDMDGIRQLLEARLDGPLTRPILVQAHETSEGNPLFAMEVARELQRHGVTSGPLPPVPPDVRGLLASRIRRLPAATRRALLMVALLHAPTVSDVSEELTAPAEEEGLVRVGDDGTIRFRHPLYASAVYDSASRSDRRRVHAELADRASDPEARAVHLAFAATGPDESTAAIVESGASHARSRGGWATAASLLEHACLLTPSDRRRDRQRRAVEAAAHHVHAGDRHRAQDMLDRLLADEMDRGLRADALGLRAEILLNAGRLSEARAELELAAALADDHPRKARIDMALAYMATNEGDWVRAGSHARSALDAAEAITDDGVAAEASASVVMYDFLAGRGVDRTGLDRALALEDRSRLVPAQMRPSFIEATLSLYTGDHETARARLDDIAGWLTSQGDESDLAFVLLWSSWLETRCGNLDLAHAHAVRATAVARLTGSDELDSWARMQGAWVGAHRGHVSQVRSECADAIARAERLGGSLIGLWVAAAGALAEISVGDFAAAWAACEPLAGGIEERGLGEPVPAFFLPDAIEALVGLGRVERAERLVDDLEQRGRDLDRVWALATGARCRAQLLAARGDLHRALSSAEDAIVHHERIDLPVDRARALLVRGQIERRLRRRARAGESLRSAHDEFERIGMTLWAGRAQRELDGLGLRRGHGDQLTPAELRVAELTARGMTRREVAAAVFVSPKTVDATLGRVYRKLGVRTRAELGARLGDRPPTS